MFGNKLLFCNCCYKMTCYNELKEQIDIMDTKNLELRSDYSYFICSSCNNRNSYSEAFPKIIKLNKIDS